ncbi:MAG: AsmA family protein [Lysobacteraceae bacterium]|nr:MAG: AsmA family protein [Xanthomonadaceae bacterium]
MPAAESRPQRSSATRHPWWTAFGILLIALLALLLLWDWNWFKGPIERRVSAQTGREFHIDGDLDVDLGRTLTIRADGLRFGNADWAREREMASAQRLEFDLRFWSLLRGDLQVPRIALVKPVLHLQRNADSVGNWTFGDENDGELPEFRNVQVKAGALTFFEPSRNTDIKVAVDSKQGGKDHAEPPIAIDGGGKWNGNAFSIAGTAESPLELRDSQRPYRIDLRATAGPTRAHAQGTLLDPLRMRDFNLQLALSGANMDDLFPLIGIALPPTPPYSLRGRLTRTVDSPVRSTWKYDGFSGKAGDSDLSGFAHVSAGGKANPYMRADLRSRRLDLDDLGGFIGLAPNAGAGETTNPELAAKSAQQQASGKLLPRDPWKLDKLRAMDADVRLRAARVETRKLPVDDMDATLALKDGVLLLKPLNFGVAGGDIRSTIRMDAREPLMRTRAEVTARGLSLGKLMPQSMQLGKTAIGAVGGDIAITSRGNSIADVAANADGSADAGMGKGEISKLLMEFAGMDLAGILKIKLTHDQQIPIRCAYGDFAVANGIMTPRALVFDTSETRLNGSGTIDLRNERLDLTLKPRTKRFSPLSLRAPLYVRGSFRNPDLRPDYARMGLRAAAAALLANVAAPAALVATSDLGKAKDAQYCGNEATR